MAIFQLYHPNQHAPKEQLIQALDDIPEPVLIEVLDFLYFLNTKQLPFTYL